MRVAVVGGGVTGMSAAYHLQKGAAEAGLDLRVSLIEKDATLGGKVGTESEDGFLLDTGPDSFMAQKPWAVELCRELGMGDQIVEPLSRRFYLLIHGRLHSVPHELVSLVPTKPEALWRATFLSFWGKARASAEGLIRPRRDVDDESLASFMRRRFGAELALRLAEPLMGGVHAGRPDRMSMAAVYPMYWQMERQHGSVTRAILERRRADAKGIPVKKSNSDPSAAPAVEGCLGKAGGSSAHIVTGMGTKRTSSPFVALRYGMASLVERLQRELQGISTDASVDAVEPLPNGAVRVRVAGREPLDVDAVILTTPSFVSAGLVLPFAPRAAEALNRIRYASTAVVSLAYRREAVTDPLDGSGFLVPRNEPSPITGCTWSSNKWEGRAPAGAVLMRVFIGRDGEDAMIQDLSDEDLADRAHQALVGLLGISEKPILSRTFKWLRSMPQYDVGHLKLVERIVDELRPWPAVTVAGSAYRGVGVPDCVRQGKEAAQSVLQRLAGGTAAEAMTAQPVSTRRKGGNP